MAKGIKHYFKNGKEHKGATHKDAKGKVMSGKIILHQVNTLFIKKIYQLLLRKWQMYNGRI